MICGTGQRRNPLAVAPLSLKLYAREVKLRNRKNRVPAAKFRHHAETLGVNLMTEI